MRSLAAFLRAIAPIVVIGASDMVIIVEAPDDETMAKFSLTTAMGGNVRTTTMKAFSEDAYRKIIAAL